MKRYLFVLSVLISVLFSKAQSPSFQWVADLGGTSEDTCFANAVDMAGNIYSTGTFSGTADFDPGPGVYTLTSTGGTDIFVSKIDASGNFIWAVQIGGASGNEVAYAIDVDASGSAFLTGYFASTADFDPGPGTFTIVPKGGMDIFACKLNSSGNFIWAKQMSGYTNEIGRGIDVDATGNVHLTGWFQGTATDFDPGPATYTLSSGGPSHNIFVCKLDPSGNFIWAGTMGGWSYDQGLGITVDNSGNVYTTGYFYYTMDLDPGPASYTIGNTAGYYSFISKLDVNGNFVFGKAFLASNQVFSRAITLDAAGNIYLAGTFYGSVDFDPGPSSYSLSTGGGFTNIFVCKLDGSGNFIWAFQKGSTSCPSCNNEANDIVVDASGIYVTGHFNGATDFGTGFLFSAGMDGFVAKYDLSANPVWSAQLYANGDDRGLSIAADVTGYVYVAGMFSGTWSDFDPGVGTYTISTTGGEDAFEWKLNGGNVSVNEIQGDHTTFNLYPNPNAGVFMIELKEETVITVSNILGQEVFKRSFTAGKGQIDIRHLQKGVYIIRNGTTGKRLVIE